MASPPPARRRPSRPRRPSRSACHQRRGEEPAPLAGLATLPSSDLAPVFDHSYGRDMARFAAESYGCYAEARRRKAEPLRCGLTRSHALALAARGKTAAESSWRMSKFQSVPSHFEREEQEAQEAQAATSSAAAPPRHYGVASSCCASSCLSKTALAQAPPTSSISAAAPPPASTVASMEPPRAVSAAVAASGDAAAAARLSRQRRPVSAPGGDASSRRQHVQAEALLASYLALSGSSIGIARPEASSRGAEGWAAAEALVHIGTPAKRPHTACGAPGQAMRRGASQPLPVAALLRPRPHPREPQYWGPRRPAAAPRLDLVLGGLGHEATPGFRGTACW